MAKKIKYGKVALVIFITVLIWVWADLALDEVLPDKPATILIDESANPKLWVSFNQASSADIKVTLSGPHTAIAEVSRKLREGEILQFDFDAAREKMDEPDSYTLPLLPFLQKDQQIKQLGLKVESCEPNTLDVQVVKLTKKLLTVECLDEDGTALKKVERIEPSKVEMSVPEDWGGSKLVAYVLLSRAEEQHARLSAIPKTPYIVLAPGQKREGATTTVRVKLPRTEERLQEYSIPSATIGYVFSQNLVGRYYVELLNQPDMVIVSIKATEAAKNEYAKQPYQMLLYILDGDEKIEGEQSKKVVYNFPEEFVRKDEIELNRQPATARFKLTPQASAGAPSGE